MRFLRILPLVFMVAILWTGAAFSQSAPTSRPASGDEQFKAGVAAFQSGDLKAARQAFLDLLKNDPSHVVTLYNLGLVEQKDGHHGRALAMWRKALVLAPEFHPARAAVKWTQSKLERAAIPHEVELWEQLRDEALAPYSLEKYVIVSASIFFLSIWMFLGYFGARRRALLDEQKLPPFPFVPIFFGVVWTLFAALAVAKLIDMQELRGTIIEKKIEARSTPAEAGTALFDLYEGLEVIVQQGKDEWLQVSYPGGGTGWIPKTAIITTADRMAQ